MATSRKRLCDADIEDCLEDSESSFVLSDDEDSGEDDVESVYSEEDVNSEEEVSDVAVNSDDDGGGGDNGLGLGGDGWTTWRRGDADFPKIPFTVQDSGFNMPPTRPQTELEFFQLFFTDGLLAEITRETNRYAAEKIRMKTPLQKSSLWQSWVDVTAVEMKAFLGVIMNMALHEKPNLQSYFSEEWSAKQPFFKDIFSRTRFLQIFWAFHLTPPPAHPGPGVTSRGSKVKNVVDYLDNKFREHFVPGQKIAIDESTVGFKGRIVFKMYNPQKPTKWGLRVYVLADSVTGYVSVVIPYYSSPTTDGLIRPDLPFTARIVLHLCDALLRSVVGTGFHLYTDRFYTGYELGLELLAVGIHTTGTVMANRKGLPTVFKGNKKLKITKHEVAGFRKDNKTLAFVWKDKRNVFMLSTYHNVDTQAVTRKITRGQEESFQKPTAIIDYTMNMGAVDRADHYCASYGFTRKSLKWWRKMFFWLFEVGIVNSYILFNIQRQKNGLKPVQHLNYRKALLTQLVGDVRNPNANRRGRPSTSAKEERLNEKPHFIAIWDAKKKKDCAVCSDRKVKGGRKETVFYCETCERKPGLHPGECFKKFHTELKFR